MRGVRATEAAVRVQAVVKGLAVHAQDVGLQVALLGCTVGAVAALEGLASCGKMGKNIKGMSVLVMFFFFFNVIKNG